MITEEAFLRAIREDPAEDAPRLVYADWLDEQGDPRAELIRFQVQLARTEEYDDNRLELEVWVERWLTEHGERWGSRLPQGEGVEWQFRRGLPEVLCAANFAAFRRATRSLGAGTTLFALHVSGLHSCTALAKSPHLGGVCELRLYDGHFRNNAIEQLVGSPHLSRLTTLILDNDRLTPTDCQALAESPQLPGLRKLDLTGNRFGDAGVRALVRSPQFRGLESLKLPVNDLGPEGMEALAGSDLLGNLTELDLSWNNLGDSGLRILARSGRLGQLERLDLSGCRISRLGMGELARAAMPRLRQLNLSQLGGTTREDIDRADEAIEALASAPFLSRLTRLHVPFPPRADGIRALSGADLSSLQVLDLSGIHFDPSSVEAFARWRSCPNLQALRLGGATGLTDGVMAVFAKSPVLAMLTHLSLGQCEIGNEGALFCLGYAT